MMQRAYNPYVHIFFHTKEGREYSRRIEFETDDAFSAWNFSKFVGDRIQHEAGMFLTDQSEFISIDIIARIRYEAYDGYTF